MKILIYGGGAVGLGVASCLIKAGAKVDIVGRKDTVSSLKKYGLIRTGIFGDFYAEPRKFNSYLSLDQIPSTIYDYILVCTKSFDSKKAANDISNHCVLFKNSTKIVLFQNGWGNAEIFTEYFPKAQIFNARVITGFIRHKPHEVSITVHADAIHIGSLFHENILQLMALSQGIAQGGIPCEITDSIEEDLWAKMLYNCALNALGAILGVPYGKLGEYEYTRKIMNGIVKEIFQILKITGHKTHWESAEDYLDIFYNQLLPSTAKHESSTLQDIQAGKKTEIDALNGAIVRLAEQFKIGTPYNSLVYNMVKFIEIQNH